MYILGQRYQLTRFKILQRERKRWLWDIIEFDKVVHLSIYQVYISSLRVTRFLAQCETTYLVKTFHLFEILQLGYNYS
jgi:hypothetical protein